MQTAWDSVMSHTHQSCDPLVSNHLDMAIDRHIAYACIDLSIPANEWRYSPQQGWVVLNYFPLAIIWLPLRLCCIPAGKTNNKTNSQHCLSAGGQRDRQKNYMRKGTKREGCEGRRGKKRLHRLTCDSLLDGVPGKAVN